MLGRTKPNRRITFSIGEDKMSKSMKKETMQERHLTLIKINLRKVPTRKMKRMTQQMVVTIQ